MLVVADGGEGEDLGLHRLFQVKHHAHHTRAVLGHTNASDVGIVGLDFAHPFSDGRVEFQAFNVNGQAGWRWHKGVLCFQCHIGFQGDARVVSGGPYPNGQQAGAFANIGPAQHQGKA